MVGGGGTPAFLADPINAVSSQLGGMNQGQGQGQGQAPMSPGNMNPYLDALYQRGAAPINRAFTDQAIPGINSSFADAGGIGGSAHALALGDASGRHSDALAGLSAGLYGGNFEAERARQFAGEQAGLQRDLVAGSAGYQGKQASQGWGDWLRQNLLPGLIEGGGTAFNTWLGGRGAGNPGGLPNIGAGTGPVGPTIPSFLRR